jgi:hypothetical protein
LHVLDLQGDQFSLVTSGFIENLEDEAMLEIPRLPN